MHAAHRGIEFRKTIAPQWTNPVQLRESRAGNGGHHRGRAKDSTTAKPLGSRPSVDVMVMCLLGLPERPS